MHIRQETVQLSILHRQKGLDSLVIIDAPAVLHGDWMSKGLDSLVIIDAPAVLHGDWMSKRISVRIELFHFEPTANAVGSIFYFI